MNKEFFRVRNKKTNKHEGILTDLEGRKKSYNSWFVMLDYYNGLR
jgi:hypothetical protein